MTQETPSNLKIFLRSLAFTLVLWVWTAIIGIAYFPRALMSRHGAIAVGDPWARGTLWLAKKICGIHYEIRGTQYFTNMPVIFASKHQSAWDTMIFLILLRGPAYVLKRSLLGLPIFGQYLIRMGMIAIDRKPGENTRRHLAAQTHRALAREQRPVVIFPEGTRRAPTETKPRYHPGVAALYQQMKVPVIPVALNSGVFWGKNALMKKPGTIVLEFLEPIPPGLENRQFMRTLTQRIEDATKELVREATDPAYVKPEPEEDFPHATFRA